MIRKKIDQLSLTDTFNQDVQLLRKAPSIKLITPMTVLTEIGDITGFKALDQLCSYFGLFHISYCSEKKR